VTGNNVPRADLRSQEQAKAPSHDPKKRRQGKLRFIGLVFRCLKSEISPQKAMQDFPVNATRS
jgi:hypothetical protein